MDVEVKMSPILFNGYKKYLGGKTHFPIEFDSRPTLRSTPLIILDEASLIFSSKEHKKMISAYNEEFFPEVCEFCLGTGKTVSTLFDIVPCPYCNETGYVKKCTCGSGIKIGKNEFFCIMCKPKPEPDLSVLLNRRAMVFRAGPYIEMLK